MPQISLTPVTLRSVMHTMQQLGYALAANDGRAFYWEKKGKPAKGLEKAWKTWPQVVSKHHPFFTAEGHDALVYDRSDVTDLIVEITGTGRTNGARVVALLRSDTKDPDLPLAHVIATLCANCGKPSKVDRWKSSLTTVHLRCPYCGHEEARFVERPSQAI